MSNYNYYTPVELARALMDMLPEREYKNAIDICSGSWNLLKAASDCFPNIIMTGVDVDPESRKHMIENSTFIKNDGRLFSINNYHHKQYDLILSNPPFGRLNDSERVIYNYKSELPYRVLLNKRYENEMVVANMMLTHNNSVFIAILPSTFIEGVSNLKGRIEFSKEFDLCSIIKLPINTFKNGRINCYAIICTKKNENRFTNDETQYCLASYENYWNIQFNSIIKGIDIGSGKWTPNMFSIDKKIENAIAMYRGNISCNEFKNKGTKILHCSSNVTEGIWKPKIVKTSSKNSKLTFKPSCNYGDIIINRIGRKAGYWCFNNFGSMKISDCLISISNPSDEIVKKLVENTRDGQLQTPVKGVTTSYVTMDDIKCLLI